MLYLDLEWEILSTNKILFFKKTDRLKDVLSHPLRLLFIFFFFLEDKLIFPLIFIYLS